VAPGGVRADGAAGSWYAAALAAHHTRGAARPLLVVLDCKGDPDARTKADRTRSLLHAAGAARVAIWPDEATVSLWGLPPAGLAVTLFQLIETGTGDAAYYADVTQAVITSAAGRVATAVGPRARRGQGPRPGTGPPGVARGHCGRLPDSATLSTRDELSRVSAAARPA
jgi:hypothetical protein